MMIARRVGGRSGVAVDEYAAVARRAGEDVAKEGGVGGVRFGGLAEERFEGIGDCQRDKVSFVE